MSSKVQSRAPGSAARARARKAMLRRTGGRVRALRDDQGMPRRTLAELSGVSVRFLAQLESGAGNISVARLADVAHALGTTASALLAPRPGGVQNAALRANIDALVDERTEGELVELRAWLESRSERRRGRIVALLGLRGAGKSTVGTLLARTLEVPLYELDALIEEAAGLSLAEIFALHGEAYYRRLERETLAAFLARTREAVLATGGSIVTDPETFGLLRRRCATVWLRASPEDHWNRVLRQGDQRPMAEKPHAMAELRALLAARARLYAEADHAVDTTGTTLAGVVAETLRRLGPAVPDAT
jgi:XRE family aerobic/anaerobic benzoate catabolism transcriptional regulator